MAERGHPVSEHCPPGGSSPAHAGISTDILSLSRSSADMVTTPHPLDKANQGPPGASSLPTDAQNGGKPTLRVGAHSADSTPDHPVVRNTGRPPCSMAEPHMLHGMVVQPLLEEDLNHQHAPPCCGERGLGSSCSHRDLSGHRLAPGALPAQRSHSDMLQTLRESPVPHLHCENAAATTSPSHLGHAGLEHYHGPQPCHGLVCQQAMHPQQSASLTASPRGPSPTPLLHPQHQLGCVPGVPSNSPMCCGPYGLAVVPGAMEETLAAYCHHQPIPAHVQMLPPRGLPGVEAQMLALPRLISSLSETGLDAKRMLRCCNLDCGWSNVPSLHSQPHVGTEGWANANANSTTTTTVTTRDMGTMTSCLELRNVGVQVEQALETPPPHVFPEVCLVDDGANGAAAGPAAGAAARAPTGKKRASEKSPVKEVKWDAEGMTWEVYGASVDPEELGSAIQKHLELQIETVSRAAKLSRQNTTASQGAGSESAPLGRKRKGLMESLRGSLRGPGCCTHATTAVE